MAAARSCVRKEGDAAGAARGGRAGPLPFGAKGAPTSAGGFADGLCFAFQLVIKSKKIAVLNYSLQILILVYIMAYVIVYDKGYQETSKATGDEAASSAAPLA